MLCISFAESAFHCLLYPEERRIMTKVRFTTGRLRRRLSILIFGLALGIALLLQTGVYAAEKAEFSVQKTGITSITGYQYYIDPKKLSIDSAEFTSDGSFEVRHNCRHIIAPWDEGGIASGAGIAEEAVSVVYTQNLPEGKNTLQGGFSLKYSGAAQDAAGNGFDVEIEVSNILLEAMNAVEAPFELMTSASAASGKGQLCAVSNAALSQGGIRYSGGRISYAPSTGNSFDITIRILDPGTGSPVSGAFIWGIQDVDIADNFQWIRDGKTGPFSLSDYLSPPYCMKYYPADGAEQPSGYFESVELLSGVESDVYLTPSSYLRQDSSGKRFWGSRQDSETWDSGLAALGNAEGFTFRWTGSVCGSEIIMPVERYTITATVSGSYPDGGTITDLGETFYFPGASNTYTISPKTGFYIKTLKVDGTAVPADTGYTFSNITADHVIDVSFAPYTPKQVMIRGMKVLNADRGRKLKANEFTFGLYSDPGCEALLETQRNDGSGNITFSQTFHYPETKTFYIRELSGSEQGMTYSSAVYRAVVTVTDAGGGGLSASVDYPDGEPVFTNEYVTPVTYYDLSVEKNVAGNMGDKSQAFEFTLTMQNPEITLADPEHPIRYFLGEETGTVVMNGAETSFVPDGQTEGRGSFALSHAETIRITGIPEKTEYRIAETDADKDGYKTTVSGNAEGVLTQSGNIRFTNRRNAPVPTGVQTVRWAGVAAVSGLIAAAGVMLLHLLKKSKTL